jgi:hypothetical protein
MLPGKWWNYLFMQVHTHEYRFHSYPHTFTCKLLYLGVKLGLLTTREKQRVRVFENRVLRRISGPERNEIIGSYRKSHNEELHNLYTSLII